MARLHTPSLLFILAAAAALPRPALAVIAYQAKPEGDPQAFLERYHQVGVKHPNVAGIFGIHPQFGPIPCATGTLVGFSKDGSLGYLLTAAHPFYESPASDRVGRDQGYRICFEPRLPEDGKAGLQVQPSRLIIHPGRTRAASLETKAPFILEKTSPDCRNDLALLEFPAATLGPALAKAGVVRAELPETSIWEAKDVEARVVGYGFPGTSLTSGFLVGSYRIHGGNTTVTHATYGDLTGYFHWAPLAPQALFEPESRPGGNRPYRFLLGSKDANLVNPLDGGAASVRSAKMQVMTAPGDSGGPLFFNTKAGFRLVGVCAGVRRADLKSAYSAKPDVPCLLERWEPLKGRQDWIAGVLAGELGNSGVVQFKDGVATSATPAKAATKSETKIEGKGEGESKGETKGDSKAEVKAAGAAGESAA